MISRLDLENLIRREDQPGSPVLSVYLDVDQSRAANRNHGFEVAFKTKLRALEQTLDDERQRRELAVDAGRVLRFVSEYEPKARGLVLFCDASEGFFWPHELNVPLCNQVHWNASAHVRPLLEALDEFERYGVILANREQARLFTVFLGEIEEHREALATADVKRFRMTGTDHLQSQEHFQRKADLHVRWHLKHVADVMDRIARVYAFDRLVLAGPVEATSELYRLLPKRLCARVVGSIHLPIEASDRQVLEATRKIELEVERAAEIQLVEELITTAAKREQAVVGLDATLAALQEGRLWQLVYAEEGARPGYQCTHCATLFAEKRSRCTYCDAATQPVDDLVERVAERVAQSGGKIEPVHGTAADRLKAAGRIGAFLRF